MNRSNLAQTGRPGLGAAAFDYSRLSQLQSLLGNQATRHLIDLFHAELDRRPVLIENAARSGCHQEVRVQAHALVGASGNIGAVRLAELARSLELAGSAPSALALDELRQAVAAARAAIDRFPEECLSH